MRKRPPARRGPSADSDPASEPSPAETWRRVPRSGPQRPFRLVTDLEPRGDQPRAIDELVAGVEAGDSHQVLLGITGSGKTFTMANVVQRVQRPTLVLAHNKTLAAQLYAEFAALFPDNAVEYFVSYYDYYQPEAYIPSTDLYIEKDSQINDEIDRMRHSATRSLLERNDVLIVASVSCIFGLGSAEAYYDQLVFVEEGQQVDRDRIVRKLVEIQYSRNDVAFTRGTFRVRGDVVEVFPAYEEDRAIRIEFWGDEVESISEIDPLRGVTLGRLPKVAIYPSSHYVTDPATRKRAIRDIQDELRARLQALRAEDRLVEAQRLEQRTLYDLELLEQMGYCKGIENYSRHLTGRKPGDPPPCLLDYFPKDYLLFIDESHVTVPQVGGMYRGDRARKETLVDFGFRLPSALDNRPLRFDEFEKLVHQVVYVSATPADFELDRAKGVVVEQIIRPTGLLDPEVEVRPATGQVDDLLAEIRQRVEQGDRVLVTTLTKRLAEDLTEFFQEAGVKVRYLHSDIDTLERIEIVRDLRLGEFDVLVGINLLREGLDIPEVSLVAILDADKEGFLRSARSLIQTIGRAARNDRGKVILYANHVTDSMRKAIDVTVDRRTLQAAHNAAHGITPATIHKLVPEHSLPADVGRAARRREEQVAAKVREVGVPARDLPGHIRKLEAEMLRLARELEFEAAAELRDRIKELKRAELEAR